ncbi:MAG: hypothetical protein GY801_21100 [bacterium]|nr:hypothetical protein [bacterium]
MYHLRRLWIQGILILAFTGLPFYAYSGDLQSLVKDNKGKPVVDAVVFAISLAGNAELSSPAPVVIDQIDKEFYSYVTPVQIGTEISFPNNDKIRHHVYSFSPAKTFELPLYPPGKGAEQTLMFDRPGVVVLGCNIHDWMKAYVYVLETSFFAKTDTDGRASITGLPPGEYELTLWHPRIKKSSGAPKQAVTVDRDSSEEIEFTIALKKEWRAMRAPKASGGSYR